MKRNLFFFTSFWFIVSCSDDSNLSLKGLEEPVEVIRDQWGINHIYAKNQRDLFFAQGYAAARDRLFQFEIWRRQATGTVAEILGPRELRRDIGTRLFKFRGDMKEEMNYYHEDGEEIITAYVEGVNTYIEEILGEPEKLPMEFKLLNIRPGKWTPEVVISRHQGLLGNINQELNIGRAVALVGPAKVKELQWFHPKSPLLEMDEKVNKASLMKDILGLYNAYRKPVSFVENDIIPEFRPTENLTEKKSADTFMDHDFSLGSNNWVVSGTLTANGNTFMANDPHRRIAIPSLRYMAHLVAPGWNVIGGGEPEIPGISIGHNEHGAWGLTVFRTDGEDLYVYDLNPDDLNQYQYQGGWQDMQVIRETIKVKGSDDYPAALRYTHHGPLTYIDTANLKGYAVRCAWLEPGGSPYLASLRMDQAKTWEEFRKACNYSHIPGENMVWADSMGNIGWQSVGIAPIRRNFSGMVPVPGDGRYEWDGYLPIIEKPNVYNPKEGFFATANQNVTPDTYENWDAIGFSWSDPYRGARVDEVLGSGKKLSMTDMMALQTDYTSLPAKVLAPLLLETKVEGESSLRALELLRGWDFRLEPGSPAATIYVAFENRLRKKAHERFVPEIIKEHIRSLQLKRVVNWILSPDEKFGSDPNTGRDEFITQAFQEAIEFIINKLGDDPENWQYGQESMKHSMIRHALSEAVHDEVAFTLDAGPLPRGGNGYTPNSTGNGLNQPSGASFRLIVDTGNWDKAVGTNTPGQSGNPESPFYKNLFESWANDQYFPVYFSREKIDSVAAERILLTPAR